MKTNERFFLITMLFGGLVAQTGFADTKPDLTIPPLLPPPPLAAPAPVTATPPAAPEMAPIEMGAPAAKAAAPVKKAVTTKKKTAKATTKPKAVKKAAPKLSEISVQLKPGPAVVTVKRVNVRGQATIGSEILGRLTNTEPVTVIEEIRRDNKKADDPDVWAKIALPAGMHGWVHSQFVDAATKTVTAKKLNVRGGAGENFSVLATLQKGDTFNQIGEKSGWLEIEAPASAIAYVAAAYLRQEIAPSAPTEIAPLPTTAVAEGAVIAAPPTETPNVPPTPAPEPAVEAAQAASPAMPAPNLPMILDPSIERIVDREGVVRRTWSIQAPSHYRLVSPDTGENIVYLHSSSTNLDLSRYKGLHIIVTGEEGLDKRWKDTPVLTIRRIQVVE